jgi:hypothetical protein
LAVAAADAAATAEAEDWAAVLVPESDDELQPAAVIAVSAAAPTAATRHPCRMSVPRVRLEACAEEPVRELPQLSAATQEDDTSTHSDQRIDTAAQL